MLKAGSFWRNIKNRQLDPRQQAWMRAIERLERFGNSERTNLHIIPDEGHGYFIKKTLRHMRRYHKVPSAFSTQSLDRRAKNIIEDSSDRKSQESYFIQLADLNVYAAYHKVHPSNKLDGSMWDELGSARISEVNRLKGGPEGIVVWPQ